MKWTSSPTIAEAREIQEQLRRQVKVVAYRGEPRYVAGVDAAFSETQVFAAACLYRYPELTLVEQVHVAQKLRFPYVPGYLSFREGPALIEAIKNLVQEPDIILVDGQGMAHPRGLGSASFIGVLLNIPSIGCAKTRLVGEHQEPGARKGSWSELRYEKRVVGAALRTRDGVKPLFVSPGHLVDLESSLRVVMGCLGKYRIPEPVRCADTLSKKTAKSKRNDGDTEARSKRRTVKERE